MAGRRDSGQSTLEKKRQKAGRRNSLSLGRQRKSLASTSLAFPPLLIRLRNTTGMIDYCRRDVYTESPLQGIQAGFAGSRRCRHAT
jgi:hypothetical protein